MFGICAICEIEHELELLESGVEEDTAWEDFLCPVTGETFTHLHSPTQDAPDLGESSASDSESNPAPKRVI